MLPKMLLKIAFQSWTHAQNAAKSPVESQASEQEFEQKWDHHVRIGNRRGMKRPKNGSNEPTVRSSFIAEVASCCYSRSLFREFQSETSESWPRFSNDQTTQDLHPNFKLKTAEWSAALGSLDPSVNEAVVLHGTSPELLPQILGNGVSATK